MSRSDADRERIQERLEQSEAQFRTLVDAIPQLCWMAHADGAIFWYNKRWYEYTGTTPEMMEGWGWQSVHAPDTLPEVMTRWRGSIANGNPFDMVFPLRGADGEFHPFLTRVVPVKDVDGEVVRWFGTNTDISEQKQIEAELRKSKARLDLAVEVASLGEWEFDFKQETGSCSSRYAQVFGYPSQEQAWSFATFLGHVLPQSRAEVEEKLKAGQRGGAWDFETQIQRADKAVCWIWVRGRCLMDRTGQPARVFGTVMDITMRKNTEEALREAHHKLQDVLNSITDGVLILDRDWRYTYCSEQGADMIGMRPEDLIGKCVWEIFPLAKGTKVYEAYHHAFESGLAVHFEEFYPEPLNKWLECHCYPSAEVLSVFFRDVTARKWMEEALFKAGALQRAIFDSANFSSIATDANGIIQIFNVGAERMLGYTAAEVMNKITPADISDPHEVIERAQALSHELGTPIKPGFEALVFKASRGIEDIYELTYVRKDGSRFPAMVSVTALRDVKQVIIGYLLIGTDNSARKSAEEALFRAGALQRAIFDSANFSSIATDANGVIQIFNVGAERMLGYTSAEVMNKITPADISDPQEVIARAKTLSSELGMPIRPGFEALVFKASRGIEDIYELTYVRKDGSRFPAIVSVTALRDAQQAIIGYLLIGTDNSARKLDEEALYRAGALQRAIFNSANFSSIATDANGIIQIFNVGAERMMGYTAAEVMNRITPADISDPREVVARAEALSRELGTPIKPGFEALVFKASRGIEDIYELTYVRKDGSRFPAMVSVTALRDAHKTILGYLLIGTDNSARKLAEDALFRAGALQRAIFNSANFSSIATDATGIIQIFNVGAERMLGYTAEEVRNKITPADISDPREVIERAKVLSNELGTSIKPGFEALVFKASRGIEDIYALTYVRKDGSRFPAMVSVTALRDARENILGYLLIGTDNTARKQAEEALIRSEKLASVGRMAATIAHEINNPLSSALNAIYLVKTDPALPDCVKSHLVLAEQELGRVAHITKQALGFFREVGVPTEVDLGDVFDSVLDIYRPRLRSKDIEVRRRYRSGTRIHAIDEEIRQVASNIFANSLQALSQGGKLHVRLFGPQSLRGPRSMVRLTIADDGEGIAKENLKQIFEPFFTTRQSVGTGLGLWMTSELVRKHEGRMRIKSQLGKGTVISIWLPMERRGPSRRAA